MAAGLAFVSAALFALGAVLQQRVAMTEQGGGTAILLQLARHPVWIAGVTTYAIAYGVQCAALGAGQLVVVQPILATTTVFALPLGAWLSRQRITRTQVAAAFAVTAGLGLFLVLSDPGGGGSRTPPPQPILRRSKLLRTVCPPCAACSSPA